MKKLTYYTPQIMLYKAMTGDVLTNSTFASDTLIEDSDII